MIASKYYNSSIMLISSRHAASCYSLAYTPPKVQIHRNGCSNHVLAILVYPKSSRSRASMMSKTATVSFTREQNNLACKGYRKARPSSLQSEKLGCARNQEVTQIVVRALIRLNGCSMLTLIRMLSANVPALAFHGSQSP